MQNDTEEDNVNTGSSWRINKFIAAYGSISRRKADEYIEQGRVTVNDVNVKEPGFSVDPDKDKVRLDGELLRVSQKRLYIVLNKPSRIISSSEDDKHRTTVLDLVKVKEKIYPIGRLDYDSTGLILLTNDGELTNKLLHPKFKVFKTYLVKLSRPLDEKIKKLLEDGVKLEGKRTLPSKIRFMDKENRERLYISIHEGRNRQVRKMFEKFGIFVDKLHRTEYGNIKLGSLPTGHWRYLTNEEIGKLKQLEDKPIEKAEKVRVTKDKDGKPEKSFSKEKAIPVRSPFSKRRGATTKSKRGSNASRTPKGKK